MSGAGATSPVQTRAIPYRESAEVSGIDVAGAFGAAIALLALALCLAWLARRQGWLRRWGVASGPGASAAEGLRIEQVLRISPRTVVFRIADGEKRYLLAESRDGARWLPLTAGESGKGQGDAS
jgi:flagellar biogenesis protein FliO